MARLETSLARMRALLAGRVFWNISSTAAGGGVAEMLHTLLPYMRGGGVDGRWTVIQGGADFFALTKRIHNLLHGESGDGGALGADERSIYEGTLAANAVGIAEAVRPGDVVLLHDPQTAGLIDGLRQIGALVAWRSHIGTDRSNAQVEQAWRFLLPYVRDADVTLFSRTAYVPAGLGPEHVAVMQPSIDPAATKNQEQTPAVASAILDQAGLVRAASPPLDPQPFTRPDGSPGRIEHGAEVLRTGASPRIRNRPLVVQVSRWDVLKDPVGVLHGFAHHVLPHVPAELILAGPTVHSVVDDPEAAETFDATVDAWRALPHGVRRHIELACLPMHDLDENAAIVNALQRSAAVVVQKSLKEGFGLTASEAMWKRRAVVASGIGGLADQIGDGVSGLLVHDPNDLAAFGQAVTQLLRDPVAAERMGERARERVRSHFLHDRQIADHAELVERLLGTPQRSGT